MARGGEPTELYLALTVSGEASAALDVITAANATGRIATVQLVPDPNDPPGAPVLADLIAGIQKLGLATLLTADASLARVVKADGIHLPVSKSIAADYAEAREILGTRFIIGADAGRSRHDAMSLGEAGADYIGFGIPAHVEDRETARARRQDLIAWWSEIFEVPCIAFDVETAAEAEALVRAGADYIAVAVPADLKPAGVAEFLAPLIAILDLDVTVA